MKQNWSKIFIWIYVLFFIVNIVYATPTTETHGSDLPTVDTTTAARYGLVIEGRNESLELLSFKFSTGMSTTPTGCGIANMNETDASGNWKLINGTISYPDCNFTNAPKLNKTHWYCLWSSGTNDRHYGGTPPVTKNNVIFHGRCYNVATKGFDSSSWLQVEYVTTDTVYIDNTPPTNSSWNVTSNNVVSGENRGTWNNGGTINITSNLLSLTVETDENSNGSCVLDHDWNYTYAVSQNPNYKFATTETTSHAYTVYDNISVGTHCLYCSFIDASGNEYANSSSGCLNINRLNLDNYPNVTLLSPATGTIQTSSNEVTFSCKAYDYEQLDNISLFITNKFNVSFSRNLTNSSPLNDTQTNFELYLDNGDYTWNCLACDDMSQCSFATNNFSLTVNFVPNVSLELSPGISSIDFKPGSGNSTNVTPT